MSTRADYSDEEWMLLHRMPTMVGAVVAGAAWSGRFGTMRELAAGARALRLGSREHPDNELIAALFPDSDDWDDELEQQVESGLDERGVIDSDAFVQATLDDIATAIALVTDRGGTEEARDYALFTHELGRTVAEAAKEGSLLGIGGTRVSPPEKAALAAIDEALGLDTGTSDGGPGS